MLWDSIRGKFGRQRELLDAYRRAMAWTLRHTVEGEGIAVSSDKPSSYPEVSGYFIPTLRRWGERELAIQYGRWLAAIQNTDGSWSDPAGTAPYTFDTGQVLKGLLSLVDVCPELETAVRHGCDWLQRQVQSDGRVTTPDTGQWCLPRGRRVPEAIHLYTLEPLRSAGRKWNIAAYEEAGERALAYYLSDPALTRVDTLSHFHAYIVEALLDLDQTEVAVAAMEQVASLQRGDGSVPAYEDVRWVCSTGLLQYAVIWYRLGERARAERAFARACTLQNHSGGFFGGYGQGANYFPREEISWAVKYFLDALWWKIRTGFDVEAALFPDAISDNDGRYRLVADAVRAAGANRIFEAGCGKGRFLRRLGVDFASARLFGLDLSERMLASLPKTVTHFWGSLLNIPCPDGAFDFVFCVETLEHAVNTAGAMRELARVLAPGGTMVIIDKNRDCLGRLKLAEWEQWFQAEEVADLLRQQGFAVDIVRNLSYDDRDGRDGLFLGWVARKPGADTC